MSLVGQWVWPPLLANAAGWLLAFMLSLAGHHRLTFRGHGAPLTSVGLRHFAVSAAGFVVNEATYALLLRWQPAHYGLALAAVLAGVAGLTYLVSRHWTFLRREAN